VDQIEELETDLDLRLMWLWQIIAECGNEYDLPQIAAWVRAAYGKGYIDGQHEPYGKLAQDNGYRMSKPID
jgi:hypothetical protein